MWSDIMQLMANSRCVMVNGYKYVHIHIPTSRNTPSCQAAWEEIFFGRKKREEKEEIFEKLLLNFERFFWNKDKLIEEIFEENVSIV